MNALDAFRNSSAWDPTYQLPLCPGANNPWIYGAYALKLMKEQGLSAFEEIKLTEKFIAHFHDCEVEPGLFKRWPVGSSEYADSGTSHDEIMGAAYISSELAQLIFIYLEKHDGVFVSVEEDKKTYPDWEVRFNVFRMVWLRPFLMVRSGYKINLLTQAVFAAHVFYDAFKTKTFDQGIHDQGGRLLIWIMLEAMVEAGALPKAACGYWRWKMNQLGLSPKQMLIVEPGQFPLYGGLGKDKF